jgi:CO dehydrogenase maturation factor
VPANHRAIRVAFVGKGGAGKSAVAGTVARLLARRGQPVLAVDSDPMPGLSLSLGLGVVDAPIPDEAVEERPEGEQGPRYRLRRGLSAIEAVERYTQLGPGGVRLLQFGKVRDHLAPLARSQSAFRQILDELPDDRWSLVGDLPGGTRQPFFGWARYARTLLVVVEPTAKSLLSARRLARLGLAAQRPDRILAVANKARQRADADLVRRRTGLEVVAVVPWDPALAEAERLGRALLDHAPDSPAVRVLESMADRLDRERWEHERP